jgi:hypothetical protein
MPFRAVADGRLGNGPVSETRYCSGDLISSRWRVPRNRPPSGRSAHGEAGSRAAGSSRTPSSALPSRRHGVNSYAAVPGAYDDADMLDYGDGALWSQSKI